MTLKALSELAALTGQPVETKQPQQQKPLSLDDKWKTLKAVEATLNKQFNTTNSLVRLGSKVGVPIPSIVTSLPTFDYGVMQCGGIPRGRIIEVFGPESSGKTTTALHIVASDQKAGNLAAFVDAEHALDPTYAAKLGVDVNNLLVSQPDSGEQALETVIALIESRAISTVVIDSVAALVPQAELDGDMGDSHMGLQARLMSQAMRKIRGIAAINNVTVIFINQIREKVGVVFGSPEVTTGGRALKFFASVRLEVRKVSKTDKGEILSGGVLIGHRMRIKAVKNKCGSPFRETIVDLIYGVGIDTVADVAQYAIDLGVIQKNGAWFAFPDVIKLDNVQGVSAVKEAIASAPQFAKVLLEEIAKAHKAQAEADAA